MDDLTTLAPLSRLALALGIGLLVGIERGWRTRDARGGTRIAGVRTYALMGLLGGVWAMVGTTLGPVVTGFAFLGFAGLVIYAYHAALSAEKDFGLTSEIAALLVFALGALAVLGDPALAAASAVAVVTLLDTKRYLHTWVQNISRLELEGAIRLLIISVVVLPFLPNTNYGPGGVLNPYKMWLMVVFVAALSFGGYIAIRNIGPRFGAIVTGLFGGLASSTAVTLGFARLGKSSPELAPALVAGIGTASAVMFVRVVLVIAAFNPALAPTLALPLGLMAAVSALGVLVISLRTTKKGLAAEIEIENPCDVSTAVKFGLLLGVVALLAHYARIWIGDAGVYAVSAVSGLVDVDAITLNMVQMAGVSVSEKTAAAAILIAVAVNTAVKFAFVGVIAGRAMALPLAALSGAALAAGGVGLALL